MAVSPNESRVLLCQTIPCCVWLWFTQPSGLNHSMVWRRIGYGSFTHTKQVLSSLFDQASINTLKGVWQGIDWSLSVCTGIGPRCSHGGSFWEWLLQPHRARACHNVNVANSNCRFSVLFLPNYVSAHHSPLTCPLLTNHLRRSTNCLTVLKTGLFTLPLLCLH